MPLPALSSSPGSQAVLIVATPEFRATAALLLGHLRAEGFNGNSDMREVRSASEAVAALSSERERVPILVASQSFVLSVHRRRRLRLVGLSGLPSDTYVLHIVTLSSSRVGPRGTILRLRDGSRILGNARVGALSEPRSTGAAEAVFQLFGLSCRALCVWRASPQELIDMLIPTGSQPSMIDAYMVVFPFCDAAASGSAVRNPRQFYLLGFHPLEMGLVIASYQDPDNPAPVGVLLDYSNCLRRPTSPLAPIVSLAYPLVVASDRQFTNSRIVARASVSSILLERNRGLSRRDSGIVRAMLKLGIPIDDRALEELRRLDIQ